MGERTFDWSSLLLLHTQYCNDSSFMQLSEYLIISLGINYRSANVYLTGIDIV